MARIHARVKGKSGSTRPVNPDMSFVTLKAKEVEKLVLELAKDDVKASLIGMKLRDTYSVPSVKIATGKTIGTIIKEAKLQSKLPEDLQALVDRSLKLKKHLEFNTRDTHNKRSLQLIESKIRRLSKYYKRTQKIDDNWSVN